MPYAQATFTTFVKGLITEASEMTFPEEASTDELNCDLLRDGSRRRRLGIEFESGAELSAREVNSDSIVSTNVWSNVAEQGNKRFLVVQKDQYVKFYDFGASGALSANALETTTGSGTDYELDLSTYERPAGNGAAFAAIQVASIKGALFIASPELNTIYVTWNPSTGAFTVTELTFRVRDFKWQGDTSDYYEKSASNPPGADRQYDTKNAGWVGSKGSSALSSYASAQSGYPPLTHPWYSGKNSSGNFDEAEWRKVYTGTTLTANGHYLLDLYSKDRQTASGIGSVTNSTEDARFSTVVGYSGRVFYSGMSQSTDDNGTKIFFSQILQDGLDVAGDCHQVNDPTSEELSDLLDSDGGFISIPEAYNIKKLHVFGPDLWVFAANGVWRISGVDGVFRATEFAVTKVSEDGLAGEGSFVSASGRPYWWSNNGIFTLQAGEGGSIFSESISLGTIQTFFEEIDASKRLEVRGTYDKANRRVLWMYADDAETSANKRNNILIFDEPLTAFIPWRISDQASSTDYMVDLVYDVGETLSLQTFNVVDNSDNQVVDGSGNNVVVELEAASASSSQAVILVVDGATNDYTFAAFTSPTFLDWGDANFSSYAETAYNFWGDAESRKTTPYITVYMKTTETGFTESGGGYIPTRESGMQVSNYWDFKTATSSVSQQAYRLKYPTVVDTGDLSNYTYPATVVTTRLKLRGRGRVTKLRFASEQGKDFHLLGYHVIANQSGRF